jgi:hypothetical protein
MTPEALRSILRNRPFHPFTLHMLDGRTLHVSEPLRLAMNAHTAVVVSDDSWEWVDLSSVVSIEVPPLGKSVGGVRRAQRKARRPKRRE